MSDAPFSIKDGAGLAAGAVALHYAAAQMLSPYEMDVVLERTLAIAPMLVVPLVAARGQIAARLALRVPRARFVVAAVVFGCFHVAVVTRLNTPIVELIGPDHRWHALRSETTLGGELFVTGLLGPIAEEVVFRGVLVRALATAWSPLRAIAVGAVAFALYHHSLYQLVGPLVFGAMTGLLVVRARSLVPALVAHVCTNTYVTLHAYRWPAPLWRSIDDHRDGYLVACGIATFTAFWIAARGEA